MMDSVLFTKLFLGCDLEMIADTATDIGFDGIDLLIRPGHQLGPNAPEQIGDAVRLFERHGLQVPMATTDLTDPTQLPTTRLLAGCAEAGITQIRLGYWTYDPKA